MSAVIKSEAKGNEGVVFVRRSAPYKAGEDENSLRLKFKASASVQVLSHNARGKRSVNIGLADGKRIGSVSIPDKWGPLPAQGTVIEVEYLNARRGGSLVQAVFKGLRPDVPADNDTKLQYKGEARDDDERTS